VLIGEAEAGAVGGGEQFGLALLAAMPDGPDRVDDALGRQPPAGRDRRLSGRHLADSTAFGRDARPASPVDRPTHPAAWPEGFVGGVHDRVDLDSGDVALNEPQPTPANRRFAHAGLLLDSRRLPESLEYPSFT